MDFIKKNIYGHFVCITQGDGVIVLTQQPLDGPAGHHREPAPFTHRQNGTPLFFLFKFKTHSARMKSQKLYICVEQNGRHTFADAELNSELAKTNFSGQAPGAAGVSLIYMEIFPACVQPPRKQH